MAYYTKFRQKALEAVRNGRTKAEINELLYYSQLKMIPSKHAPRPHPASYDMLS
jgi:hypothetical protein